MHTYFNTKNRISEIKKAAGANNFFWTLDLREKLERDDNFLTYEHDDFFLELYSNAVNFMHRLAVNQEINVMAVLDDTDIKHIIAGSQSVVAEGDVFVLQKHCEILYSFVTIDERNALKMCQLDLVKNSMILLNHASHKLEGL